MPLLRASRPELKKSGRDYLAVNFDVVSSGIRAARRAR
jgi:hypothetical protein